MPSFVSRLAVVAVPLLFTVGCAAETASEAPTEEEAGESQEALSTCGSAKYGEALVHYKAAVKAGIDPVYFGLMFVLNGAIGLITPPVGTVLNVVAGVGRLSLHQVVKGVNPFLVTYLAILVMFVLFPSLVTAPVAWMR